MGLSEGRESDDVADFDFATSVAILSSEVVISIKAVIAMAVTAAAVMSFVFNPERALGSEVVVSSDRFRSAMTSEKLAYRLSSSFSNCKSLTLVSASSTNNKKDKLSIKKLC